MSDTAGEGSLTKYRKLFELGRGGMASVWLAMHEGHAGFRKLVVIKEPRHDMLEEPEFRRMFFDEARLAARLNHPNVVQTIEVGEQYGQPFLTMEYLDGQPLNRIREACAVPMLFEIHILANVLRGLHYAHELSDFDGTPLSIVHRDISPHNVFVTYDGQVKVVDFGIAKAIMTSSETEVGEVKGKIAYMGPDQASGRVVDRRADLFAVGIMLWETLTGRRIWHGLPTVAVLVRLMAGALPSVREHATDVPEGLLAICERSLGPEGYGTAVEFLGALEAHVRASGEVVTSHELGQLLSKAFADDRQVVQTAIRAHASVLPSSGFRPPPSLGRVPTAGAKVPRTGTATKEMPDGFDESLQDETVPAWAMEPPYRLLRPLHESAFAKVFEALRIDLDRKVIVKVLKALVTPDPVRVELMALAALRHPNTARLLDMGMSRSRAQAVFLVRDHADGPTLRSVLTERGARGPRRAVHTVVQVLLSLAEAHERGVVHGTIDPTHVIVSRLVGSWETVKVIGYDGAARLSGAECRRLPQYVAPEIVKGGLATPASDLYAVGLLLYECLAGRCAFDGSDETTVLHRQVHEAPAALGEALPEDLVEIVNRSLAKEPGARFRSAEEFIRALRGAAPADDDDDADRRRHAAALALDRKVLGRTLEDYSEIRAVRVNLSELVSTRRPSLWFFTGDPAMDNPVVREAIARLGERFEVVPLDEDARGEASRQLLLGSREPPWVLVFGDLHVLLGDSLFHSARPFGEISRLLISTHANADLLHSTVNECGLDGQVCLPAAVQTMIEAAERMVERTRRLHRRQDELRLALREAREHAESLDGSPASDESNGDRITNVV